MTHSVHVGRKLLLHTGLAMSILAAWGAILGAPSPAAANDLLPKTRAMLSEGTQTVRVVCFGDSITGVYYHTGGRRAWCDMLGIALQRAYPKAKVEMINAGISGHSTVQALARIQKDVLDKKPQLVVIKFGMNDVVAADIQKYVANMRQIVNQCRQAGAEVVICTPNAVFPEDKGRPVDRLEQYCQAARDLASEMKVPLVDLYAIFDAIRKGDHARWLLIMSDAIHPAMAGHKLFAESIARCISGKAVGLEDVGPIQPCIPFTLARLAAKKSIKVVATEPYDAVVPEILRQIEPAMGVYVMRWPVAGRSVPQIATWAKAIRDYSPDLVIVSVPAEAFAEPTDAVIRDYHWVLSWSLSFGHTEWDVVTVLPSVAAGDASKVKPETERLIRDVTLAQDLTVIERKQGDSSPPEQILLRWFRSQREIKP